MGNYRIELSETVVRDEAGREVLSYGIIAQTEEKRITFSDLSLDKQRVQKLATELKNLQPEPKIIPEIIEDFIS